MSSGNILVVDDEPQIRRVMRMALSSQGFEVIEARSGEEGLEKFRDHLPDLVLLDGGRGQSGRGGCWNPTGVWKKSGRRRPKNYSASPG